MFLASLIFLHNARPYWNGAPCTRTNLWLSSWPYLQLLECPEEFTKNKLTLLSGASIIKNKKFHKIDTSGLYYKFFMIVIYALV